MARSRALFTEANNLLDTWIGHFDLGRAYLETGRLPKRILSSTAASGVAVRRWLFSWMKCNVRLLTPVYYYQAAPEKV